MGTRTSYAPGTLSWAELVTSDADAAKTFYTSLFGWDYEDNPVDVADDLLPSVHARRVLTVRPLLPEGVCDHLMVRRGKLDQRSRCIAAHELGPNVMHFLNERNCSRNLKIAAGRGDLGDRRAWIGRC